MEPDSLVFHPTAIGYSWTGNLALFWEQRTMPTSLRSTVIDNLAQVAWLGSGCGSTSKRLGFLVGTRDPIGTDSMGICSFVRVVTAA